jgi:hypothetical protein
MWEVEESSIRGKPVIVNGLTSHKSPVNSSKNLRAFD